MKPVFLLVVAIGRRGGVPLALLMLLPLWVAWISRNQFPLAQWLLAALFGSLLAMALGAIAGMALPALQAHTPLRVAPGAERALRRLLWSISLGVGVLMALPTLALPPASLLWWLLPWSLGHMTLAAATGLAISLAPGLGMSRFAWSVRLALGLGLVALWRSMALALEALPHDELPAGEPRPLAWLALAVGLFALAAWAWAVPRLARLLYDSRAPRLDTRALERTVLASVLGAAPRHLAGRGLAQWLALRHASPWKASPWELGAVALMCAGVGYLGSTYSDLKLPGGGWASVTLWAVAVACTAVPWVQMPWMSPRTLLVPGGLQRAGLARQLFMLTLKHNAGRALFDTALLSAALWLGWLVAGREVGLAAFAALLVMGASLLPANFSVALVMLICAGGRWREASGLLLGLQPTVSLATLYVLGVRPRLDEPATLWAWAALSWLISLLLAALLMRTLARPMARLDLGRMPAAPMSGRS